MKNTHNALVRHIALWLPIAFATPLIIFMQNPDDFTGSIFTQTLLLITVLGCLTFSSCLIVKILPSFMKRIVISLLLAIATAMVVQGYIVHGLIEFGQLDGSIINWKGLGPIYRTEYKAILLTLIILTPLYFKFSKFLNTLSSILIFFSLAQILLVIPNYFQREKPVIAAEKFDDSVYEFSSTKNIIHILADGFQADIVKQVFEENPDLAKEFTGFDFFDNHLGRFQGTAPTIPTIFTGEFFDLNEGYNPEITRKEIAKKSYTNTLYDNGYRLDYVGISNIYCHESANSCVNRSFNDLKSRGYKYKDGNIFGGLMLLFDISLFRHSPLYLKKRIHNNGAWLLSANTAQNWSPFPDPVIREWVEDMVVVDTNPIYKWYHFIGTHIPAQWDANCQFVGRQLQKREFYKAQTQCVLMGMASLIKKLKQQNIYDKTVIVINGDHGCNIPAIDTHGLANNSSTFKDAFLGVTRPVFMFKRMKATHQLNYHKSATTLIDIAPTLLNELNLKSEQLLGNSAYNAQRDNAKTRSFHRYIPKTFWTGKAIAYDEYQVTGDIRNRANWQLSALNNRDSAPTSYEHMSYDTAYLYSKGLSLYKAKAKTQKEAYVFGTEFQILLSDLKEKAQKVAITLQIPPYSRGQSLSLFINNQSVAQDILLNDEDKKWITQEIHIPENTLQKENNFFRFVFSKAGVGNSKRPASANIRSISLFAK